MINRPRKAGAFMMTPSNRFGQGESFSWSPWVSTVFHWENLGKKQYQFLWNDKSIKPQHPQHILGKILKICHWALQGPPSAAERALERVILFILSNLSESQPASWLVQELASRWHANPCKLCYFIWWVTLGRHFKDIRNLYRLIYYKIAFLNKMRACKVCRT